MNTITIELCAEDRARLDRHTAAMYRLTAALEQSATQPTAPALDETQQALANVLSRAETATEPQEAETFTDTQPEPEQPKEAPKTEPQAEEKPTVTLEQIQQKVVQLAASNGGAKKPQVRAIISNYGTKVSDLKEQPDKWAEVWKKLTALEKEA